jgi:thymidylate synthase (FAD)
MSRNTMEKISLLDHGYLAYVEHWGSDERIIESARMSTDKGFKGWGTQCERCRGFGKLGELDIVLTTVYDCPKCDGKGYIIGDEKLLSYLYKHKHLTPFEMCGLTIEVQAPIFVFREWHRHRTQSYNELSGRYSELPNMFYIPDSSRIVGQSKTNKQVGDQPLDPHTVDVCRDDIKRLYLDARDTYETLLRNGVAREIARLVLPVAQYSRMRASGNLRNWLAFLTLRMDPAAQWEIRQYANTLAEVIRRLFPRTYELFQEGA